MADSRDITGKNRRFTGTTGIKLPTGTEGQRDTSYGAGTIRFNTETLTAEYYDGTSWQAISAPPTVSSVSPTNVESADGSTTTFTILGSNFTVAGATVTFVGSDGSEVSADTTSVDNTTTITATKTSTSFDNAKEPYDVKVSNNTGLSNSLADAITIDNRPAWSTAAGSLGSIGDAATGTHFTLSATDPEGDTVSYAVVSGSLPAGLSLATTGAISGDPDTVGSSTTSTFTVRATSTGDVTLTTDREFSITVTPAPTGGTLTSYTSGCTSYSVHTFTSPGCFTTLTSIPGADILIVGGGGGGGGWHAGAGGAGGLIELPGNTIGPGTYPISIGPGGGSKTNGTNTTAFGQTANGGGQGGNYAGPPATSGGSGGGGGGGGASSGSGSNQGSVQAPWTGNAYGNSGGNGINSMSNHGGGGGGGAGGGGSPGPGGTGGSGRQNVYRTGCAVYYAGGGGGGAWDGSSGSGGAGGGGPGSRYNVNGSNATFYGGGGGGSGGQNFTGGSGYQGIVVIRYT